jgi:hypothetical protein
MFAINAILMILFHLAPNLGGMAWSIYQNNGVHLVVPQSSKGTAMKPKIVIHNHYQRATRDMDGGPGSGPPPGGGKKSEELGSSESYKGYTLKQEYPGAMVDIYNTSGRKVGKTTKANVKSYIDKATKTAEMLKKGS